MLLVLETLRGSTSSGGQSPGKHCTSRVFLLVLQMERYIQRHVWFHSICSKRTLPSSEQTDVGDLLSSRTQACLGGGCCSVTKLCPTLCNPMNCSTPGFPVLHYLPEFAQIHVHWVCDAIQPSHPLSSPSPPTFNLSQHQGLFQWVGSSHQVDKVLEFQLQHQSLQWIFRIDFRIDWFDLLVVQGTLRSLLQHHSSKVPILQCSAFFMVQLSHHTWPLEKP